MSIKSRYINYLVCALILSCCPSFAMQQYFTGAPVSNSYGISLTGFEHIEPEFVDACSSKPNQNILEVGAAQGYTLKKVVSEASIAGFPINYTAVEINLDYHEELNAIKNGLKHGNITVIGQDIREFIKDKVAEYDAIYVGNVLHFFEPVEYLEVLRNLQGALKQDGKLFLIVSSVVPSRALKEAVQAKEGQGELWPGFLSEDSRIMRDSIKVKICQEHNQPVTIFKTEQSFTSLKELLSSCGFVDIIAEQYFDKNTTLFMPQGALYGMYYLGAIAKRGQEENKVKCDLYEKAAQEKRRQFEEILQKAELIVPCGNWQICGKGDWKNAFQACGRCKTVEYCSRECQIQQWPIHKQSCNK